MKFIKIPRRILASFLTLVFTTSLLSSSIFAAPSPGRLHQLSTPPPSAGQSELESLTPSETRAVFTLAEQKHIIQVNAGYKDGTHKDVTLDGQWVSTNPEVVTVHNGELTAVSPGEAYVQLNLKEALVNIPVSILSSQDATRSQQQAAETEEPAPVSLLLSTVNLFLEEDTYYPVILKGIFPDGSTREVTRAASWSTDDSSVATVTNNGVIKGIKAGGSTTVKVQYPGMPALSIAVMVQQEPVPSESYGLYLSENKIKMMPGDEPHQIYADLEFAPVKDRVEITKLGTWTSRESEIATVSADGKITPVSKGITYIYFTYKYTAPTGVPGDDNYSNGMLNDWVAVYVGGPDHIEVLPSNHIQMKPNSYLDLDIEGYYPTDPYTPEEVDDLSGEMIWTVEDKSIATINDSSRLYAGPNEGTTKITGRYLSFVEEITVTVSKDLHNGHILNLVSEPTHVVLTEGLADTPIHLKAIYSDGYVEDVTSKITKENWLMSDPFVAYRTEDGQIVGESEGSAVMGVQYLDQAAIIPVIVKKPDPRTASSITVTPDAVNLKVWETQSLSVQASMEDGSVMDKTRVSLYSSSNSEVVTVSHTGEITAIAPGQASVTVTYKGQSKTVPVNVEAADLRGTGTTPPASKQILDLTVSEPQVELNLADGPQPLNVQAVYEDGSRKDVTSEAEWTAANPDVVSAANGILTPKSAGFTKVYIHVGGATTSVPVNVVDQPITIQPFPEGDGMSAAADITDSGDSASSEDTADTADNADSSANTNHAGAADNDGTNTPDTVKTALGEPEIKTLLLSATNVLLYKDQQTSVKLYAIYENGDRQDITAQAAWETLDPSIATVDNNGLITGISTGDINPEPGEAKYGVTDVHITFGDFPPVTLPVFVREKPEEYDLMGLFGMDQMTGAQLVDGAELEMYKDGTPYQILPFAYDTYANADLIEDDHWTFSNPIAYVNEFHEFIATGTGKTDATLTYTEGTITRTLTFHLTVLDLQSLEAGDTQMSAPNHFEIHPNGSSFLMLKENYLNDKGEAGSAYVPGPVIWTVENPEVADVIANGAAARIIALTDSGTTKVWAYYFGKEIEFEVEITRNPSTPKLMAAVAEPAYWILNDDSEKTPVVKGIYSDGAVEVIPNDQISWSSDNPLVAGITDAYTVKAGQNKGGIDLWAEYKGTLAALPVINQYSTADPTVTGLTVTPNLTKIQAGSEQQLTAMAKYSNGQTLDKTKFATFESLNPEIAVISREGVVKGIKPGTAHLTVYYWGFTEHLTVTVQPKSSTGPDQPAPTPSPDTGQGSPAPTPSPSASPSPSPSPEPSPSPSPSTGKPVFHQAIDQEAVKAKLKQALEGPEQAAFTDVPATRWSYEAIRLAAAAGFVQGYKDDSFGPSKTITRAEFAVMLAGALGLKANTSVSFQDVPPSHWASTAIQALKEYGFISGYQDGTFKPNQPISRAEIAALLARTADFGKPSSSASFADLEGHWAAAFVNQLHENGIINGKTALNFVPQASATREEAVVLIMRLLNVGLGLELEI